MTDAAKRAAGAKRTRREGLQPANAPVSGLLASPLQVDVLVPPRGYDEAVALVKLNRAVESKGVEPNGQTGAPSALQLAKQQT